MMDHSQLLLSGTDRQTARLLTLLRMRVKAVCVWLHSSNWVQHAGIMGCPWHDGSLPVSRYPSLYSLPGTWHDFISLHDTISDRLARHHKYMYCIKGHPDQWLPIRIWVRYSNVDLGLFELDSESDSDLKAMDMVCQKNLFVNFLEIPSDQWDSKKTSTGPPPRWLMVDPLRIEWLVMWWTYSHQMKRTIIKTYQKWHSQVILTKVK